MLRMTHNAIAALEEACSEASPFEACGVLLGTWLPDEAAVVDVVQAGSAQTRGEFEIADHELRRMSVCAAHRGLEIVAVFHSHPSGAPGLSAADRATLRFAPWPWVVVTWGSVGGLKSLAAYAAGDGRPLPVLMA
jgi:proteasome lid subunit RPN8/RPN11